MATFQEWKRTSTLFQQLKTERDKDTCEFVERITAAAYKAGERQGRENVEKLVRYATTLREAQHAMGRP